MTMRVLVDPALCEAYGVCAQLAPDVFEVDDGDVMHLLQERPSEGLREKVEQAVSSCPKGALRIEEEQ
jgi:ferredoxin